MSPLRRASHSKMRCALKHWREPVPVCPPVCGVCGREVAQKAAPLIARIQPPPFSPTRPSTLPFSNRHHHHHHHYLQERCTWQLRCVNALASSPAADRVAPRIQNARGVDGAANATGHADAILCGCTRHQVGLTLCSCESGGKRVGGGGVRARTISVSHRHRHRHAQTQTRTDTTHTTHSTHTCVHLLTTCSPSLFPCRFSPSPLAVPHVHSRPMQHPTDAEALPGSHGLRADQRVWSQPRVFHERHRLPQRVCRRQRRCTVVKGTNVCTTRAFACGAFSPIAFMLHIRVVVFRPKNENTNQKRRQRKKERKEQNNETSVCVCGGGGLAYQGNTHKMHVSQQRVFREPRDEPHFSNDHKTVHLSLHPFRLALVHHALFLLVHLALFLLFRPCGHCLRGPSRTPPPLCAAASKTRGC